jgi:branched-chain amino acid transport system substrate-binding protein
MNTLPGKTAGAPTRRAARLLTLAAAAAALAACTTVSGGGGGKQAPVSEGRRGEVAKAQTVKIAVLLPLSGQNAAIGRSLLNAAEMALFDIADDKLELVPSDTAGSPQAAAAAAQKALSEGAALIVGPLFAQEAAAVRPIAGAAGVDMLTLSTDRRLAAAGSHVMGLTPADQVSRIMGFVRASGVSRFGVLAPRSPYGDVAAAAAQEAAARLGAQLGPVERYDPNLTDLSLPAQAMATAANPPQALLLADGGQKAQAMAQALTAAGLNRGQTQLIGTGLWDEPGVGREPGLVGGRYAAPDPMARSDFEARYKSLYGEEPPRIATLAYDATALAATLVKQRNVALGKPIERQALTSDKGFNGLDGLFRLRPDGATQRGLAVLEVTPGGARVVDPAPKDFNILGQ